LERTDVEKGQGAYGVVRVYRWPARGIMVAVKELTPDTLDALDDSAIAALAAEAALQERFSHPHIVRVFGWAADAAARRYGLVMQLYEGSLSAALRDGGLPLAARLALAVQAASGLLYLHAEGVVHGDVKPANVLLLGGAAALSDFGTAASAARAAASASAGLRGAGTPQFMAPELHETLDGEFAHGPSRAADVYALACTVYCAVVGVTFPWSGDDSRDFKPSAVRKGARPRLERLPPGVPPDLPALLQECWADDRRARPAMPAVLARLRAVLAALGGESA
jgi:serine/threonine protein kinase